MSNQQKRRIVVLVILAGILVFSAAAICSMAHLKNTVNQTVKMVQPIHKKEIQEMKEKEEQKHKTLEALRHCIHEKAEESYEKTFHENTNKHTPSHQKMDTQEMYGQLQSEKEHLTKMVKEMKDKELSKHK